jgi:ketosteroid isomerase-like protein
MEQVEIKAVLDRRSEAVRAKDIERLMAHYAPDVVYFDVVPPLEYSGSAALRGRFSEWFNGYQGGIGQEVCDLTTWVSGDVAVASMLVRSGGTLQSGDQVEVWVRATSCFHRSNGTWLITHEHISVPADLRSGRAAVDLVP